VKGIQNVRKHVSCFKNVMSVIPLIKVLKGFTVQKSMEVCSLLCSCCWYHTEYQLSMMSMHVGK